MSDETKKVQETEVADQQLEDASGGVNRNQLWGDYFAPSDSNAARNADELGEDDLKDASGGSVGSFAKVDGIPSPPKAQDSETDELPLKENGGDQDRSDEVGGAVFGVTLTAE